MPVVINRSSPGGSGTPPDKNGGKAKAASKSAAKPAAKPAPKGKKAASSGGSLLEDTRVRIGGLIGLIVVAILVVLFSMGYFSGQAPPPVNAPESTPGKAGPAGGSPGPRTGLGARAGAPIPGEPGDDSEGPGAGARLPKGSGP